jgi:hypothetical protein
MKVSHLTTERDKLELWVEDLLCRRSSEIELFGYLPHSSSLKRDRVPRFCR